MTLPIYEPGAPFTSFPDLLEWVRSGRYIHIGDKPVHPDFVMQMPVKALVIRLEDGNLYRSELIRSRPQMVRAGQFVA